MSIERDSDYYDKIYLESEEYRKPFGESKYFHLWAQVLQLIPNDASILDIGCGTGQFAHMVDSCEIPVKHYRGFDISGAAIEIARSLKLPKNFYKISAYEIDIENEDFIICLETLEHINDFKFIERIPMGVEIVFTVPDFADPAHVRYFKNITEIVHRYERHIDFSHIEKFESWFVCKGVRI